MMKLFIKRLIAVLFCLAGVCTNMHASVKAGEATVNVGATTTITLATTYQTTLRNSTGISARWSTSSSNISITSQTNTSCTIKGLSAGTAQVNYYCSYYIDGFYRTMDFYYTVTISGSGSNGPTSISISPTSLSLTEGDTYTVTATQAGAIGGTYFTTSNSSVASVSTGSTNGYKTTGTVTAQGAGSCYIYAKTLNGLSSSCYVTVKTKQVVATSISVEGPDKMIVGETYRLLPVCAPSNATVSYRYTSDNSNAVSVSASGLLTAVAAGKATITVTETISKLTKYLNVEVVEPIIPDTDISAMNNVVYIGNVSSCAGQELTLSIKMKNCVEVQGFGFDLYLPDGINVAKDEEGFNRVSLSTERTTEKKTNYFDSNILENGALRVLASSTGGYTISGTDGEIVKVVVTISKDVKEGDYPIWLREIALSDNNSIGYETDYVKSTLTITDYISGDVNGDSKINVVDFTAIANHVLGKSPEGFLEKAADLNGDGKVNVVDLTAVANLILYGNISEN